MSEDDLDTNKARDAALHSLLQPFVWFAIVLLLLVVVLQISTVASLHKVTHPEQDFRPAKIIVQEPEQIPTLPEVAVVGKKE